jgi:EPS-associated MarR family transcriptional regulator
MDENYLKTLRILTNNANLSQREIAKELNLSLGKANYILNALIEKGYIEVGRFKKSNHKLSYIYLLTPEGIKKKLELTHQFFKIKSQEYESLKEEMMKLGIQEFFP